MLANPSWREIILKQNWMPNQGIRRIKIILSKCVAADVIRSGFDHVDDLESLKHQVEQDGDNGMDRYLEAPNISRIDNIFDAVLCAARLGPEGWPCLNS